MYLKLKKHYQIEYYLYCLNFVKYCIFYLNESGSNLIYKNTFIKSKLPYKSKNMKVISCSYNFNLLYFQYFKEFYNFIQKNFDNSLFVKVDKHIFTNKQIKRYLTNLIKRPLPAIILKPIILVFKILNQIKECQH